MTERARREWSLVVFTVCLELGCGIAAGTVALEVLGSSSPWSRAAGISVFPIVLIAIIASTLHLGVPLRGWRALANSAQSRLSHEVLVCSVFCGTACVYSAMWLTNAGRGRVGVGLVTATLGLVSVVASARVYTITAQPFWRSIWVPASFIGATMMFASLPTAMLSESNGTLVTGSQIVTGTGAVVILLSSAWMLQTFRHVSRSHYTNAFSRPILGTSEWASFAGAVILAGVIPLLQAGFFHELQVAGSLSVLLVALVGVTLSRVLMYSVGNQLSRF